MVGGIENEGESMPRTRKSRPPSLKAKVEVETIRARTKRQSQIAQVKKYQAGEAFKGKLVDLWTQEKKK